VALILVPIVFFGLWAWSESDRAVEHPAVILVPLPLFACLSYLLAAIALGSSRVVFRRDRITWRNEGLPTLPERTLARTEVASVGYWQQSVPTRFGSYTTGVTGLVLRDGTRIALIDTFETVEQAKATANRIAGWLGNTPVGPCVGLPARRDVAYYRRLAYAGVGFCALLILTAVLGEYYRI
jgi:hypothetical protein